MQPILVRHLRIESVSDPTPDPYGQPGFSTLTAYVDAADPALVRDLRRAADEDTPVVIRCATVEVEGRVGKHQFATGAMRDAVSISVDDLRYFKPKKTLVVKLTTG